MLVTGPYGRIETPTGVGHDLNGTTDRSREVSQGRFVGDQHDPLGDLGDGRQGVAEHGTAQLGSSGQRSEPSLGCCERLDGDDHLNRAHEAYATAMSTPPVLVPLQRTISDPDIPALRRVTSPLTRLMRRLVRVEWHGLEHLHGGGMVAAANHISYADFLSLGHFALAAGRWPHFLGKESLFRLPVIGRIVTSCEQIPVHRGSSRAAEALASAESAVRQGKLVLLYPEGTVTKDPEQWPMTGRHGAVRMALGTGCPLVPVGQWGAQDFMPAPGLSMPRPLPRKTFRVMAGPPLDLDDYRGKPLTPQLLSEATAKLMAAISGLVGILRGEDPPAEPFRLS